MGIINPSTLKLAGTAASKVWKAASETVPKVMKAAGEAVKEAGLFFKKAPVTVAKSGKTVTGKMNEALIIAQENINGLYKTLDGPQKEAYSQLRKAIENLPPPERMDRQMRFFIDNGKFLKIPTPKPLQFVSDIPAYGVYEIGGIKIRFSIDALYKLGKMEPKMENVKSIQDFFRQLRNSSEKGKQGSFMTIQKHTLNGKPIEIAEITCGNLKISGSKWSDGVFTFEKVY